MCRVAFIPARGGSKSIKLKNIKEICGKPLIYWTLDAAATCTEIDKIYVATDSEIIAETVRNYGNPKVVAIGRNPQNTTDTATTESAMLEFAEKSQIMEIGKTGEIKEIEEFDEIVLIQATSPLLKAEHLTEGINLMQQGFDSVLSVVKQKRFIWQEKNGITQPVNYDFTKRPMRQNFDGYLVENGAFYITSRKSLLQSKCRISGKIGLVEMPEESYFEVDEPSDWDIIEHFLQKSQTKSQKAKPNFSQIKALFTDCDGVMTDGGMYYGESGEELKKFNTKDGMAFELLRNKGIITGIISGENCALLRRRAEKLKTDEIHLGIKDKKSLMESILPKYNLNFADIAYIGDDINDIELLKCVGFGCCVADAVEQVKRTAAYITVAKGGGGAVREVAEKILQ
ncbi:MAG: N-acylneuraminate cytidylyltransferase [Firmicutes bacterium]|nr:N-acylneuraminate cytidylyltransferase [Bacillota bacterium]